MRTFLQENLYDLLDTSTKRTLTTVYNNRSHALRVSPQLMKSHQKLLLGGKTEQTQQGSGEDDAEGTAPLRENTLNEEKDDADEATKDNNEDADLLDLASYKIISSTSSRGKRGKTRAGTLTFSLSHTSVCFSLLGLSLERVRVRTTLPFIFTATVVVFSHTSGAQF